MYISDSGRTYDVKAPGQQHLSKLSIFALGYAIHTDSQDGEQARTSTGWPHVFPVEEARLDHRLLLL